jgi:hypothetical protein
MMLCWAAEVGIALSRLRVPVPPAAQGARPFCRGWTNGPVAAFGRLAVSQAGAIPRGRRSAGAVMTTSQSSPATESD